MLPVIDLLAVTVGVACDLDIVTFLVKERSDVRRDPEMEGDGENVFSSD
jgi:hypothetical protein